MRRLLFLLVLVAGCGTETKTHCAVDSDCLNGDSCVGEICQGASADACGATHDKCAADATCASADDKLACTCKSGFTGDGLSCADVDECAADQPVCSAHATCTNAPGAFSCACDASFTGDGSTYCVPSQFTKVVAGGTVSCGLSVDGGIYCWGLGYDGQIGNGSTLSAARPSQVGTATDWIDVGTRLGQGCGLRADHSIWCWGLGTTGSLGNGTTVSSSTPVQVVSDKPGVGWKSMSVGNQQMCAIHTDGSAACWGQDRITNQYVTTPVAVDAHTDWTKISAGKVRCGLRDGGHLYCWGKGNEGELGLGDVLSQPTPAQVGSDTWRDVFAGHFVTCGIRSDGALLCWGKDVIHDALLYGNTPVQVGTATDWESITISSYSIIGLRAGGKAYAWGANDSGQLAQPLTLGVETPAPLGDPNVVWSQVWAGNTHSCGIAGTQTYCWGDISDGLLGDGQTTTWLAPTRLTSESWTSIATGGGVRGVRGDGGLMASGFDIYNGVGFGNTDPVWAPARIGSEHWDVVVASHDNENMSCALRDGTPYCWGSNTFGEAGVGNLAVVSSPTAVKVPVGSRWTELTTGQHTCAIRSDGALFCWGNNQSGELGNGSTSIDPVVEPPATALSGTWNHVAAAGNTTCAIRSDHTLWCWGKDAPASPTVMHLVPTQLDLATDWDSITMKDSNGLEICAIKTTGTLWCWGGIVDANGGRVVNTPTQVGRDASWKTISVGVENCGIRTDGTLWCWDNGDVLGDGTPYTIDLMDNTARALTPKQIGSDTDWKAVTTGGPQCGLKTDGSVLCWGFGAKPITGIATTPAAVK